MATDTARRAPDDRATRPVAYALVAVAAFAFLAVSWGRIAAPFGDSDEGINGAVWATASRSLRELGPVGSALGGRHLDGSRYATHPPLIISETALAETIAGEHRVSSRAAAWVGTLAAIVLLYRLGRRLGFTRVAAAGGTVVAGTTGMAVAYGSMLDTPVTAFPFAVGLTIVWVRDWQGDDPPRRWLVAALALAASLAGWQGVVLAVIAGSALAVKHRREPRRMISTAAPYLAGAAVGVMASIGWSWWVYGDLSALEAKLGRRSGSSRGINPMDVVTFQVPWLAELLGVGLVGLIGSVAALWDRSVRPATALSLATVFGYAFLFREAAAGHQYWCYWVVLPVAIGSGWLLGRFEQDLRSRQVGPVAARVAVVVVVLIAGAFDLARSNTAVNLVDEGHTAIELLEAQLPAAQATVPYVGEEGRPEPVVAYELGRASLPIRSTSDLRALADEHPDDLVLVLGTCNDDDASATFCRRMTQIVVGTSRGDGPTEPRLIPAADLARRDPAS